MAGRKGASQTPTTTDIAVLGNQVETVEKDISNMYQAVNKNGKDIAAISARLEEMSKHIANLSSRIDRLIEDNHEYRLKREGDEKKKEESSPTSPRPVTKFSVYQILAFCVTGVIVLIMFLFPEQVPKVIEIIGDAIGGAE